MGFEDLAMIGLNGLAGGIDKYGQLQDEDRQYNRALELADAKNKNNFGQDILKTVISEIAKQKAKSGSLNLSGLPSLTPTPNAAGGTASVGASALAPSNQGMDPLVMMILKALSNSGASQGNVSRPPSLTLKPNVGGGGLNVDPNAIAAELARRKALGGQ